MKIVFNPRNSILSATLAVVIGSGYAADLHVVYPHYSWIEAPSEYYSYNALPKTERLKSYAGDIFVDYDEALPLEIRTCARLAVDIWEPEIRTSVPVRLKVAYAPLESPEGATLTVTADVAFRYDEGHDTAYPSSLYRQLNNEDSDDYDAVITINSNIPATDWSYTVVHRSPYYMGEKYSLTTSVMRAIGNALGIGSGIDYSGDLPALALPALTPYDRLISFGSDNELSLDNLDLEMGQPSEELANLLTDNPKIFSDLRYVLNLEKGKILDTPAINFAHRNSQYLYICEAGMGTPHSDSYLKKILAEIGWDTEKPSIGIYQSQSPSETGILVENSFLFYDNKNISVTAGCDLYIDFFCKDGTILHKLTPPLCFDLPDESELEQLECNVNGDIYGYVAGTLTTHPLGSDIRTTTPVKYRLSIPQPPAINGIKIMSHPDFGKYLLVTYQGAESIGVRITDSDGNTTSEALESPYNAIIPLSRLYPNKKYTITLFVGNNKGVCQEEVFINGDDISIGLAGISDISDDDALEWDRMEVYDLNGRAVASDSDGLPNGIYIVVYYNGSSPVKRDKIII